MCGATQAGGLNTHQPNSHGHESSVVALGSQRLKVPYSRGSSRATEAASVLISAGAIPSPRAVFVVLCSCFSHSSSPLGTQVLRCGCGCGCGTALRL